MKDKNKLTPKQERFALNLFKGMSQREAWIGAGYSNRYPVQWIDSHACSLAALGKVKVRIEEYRTEAKNAAIADINEAGAVATEILRARFADFDLENPTQEQLRSAAVREVSKTDWAGGKEGRARATRYKLKLESPLAAIDRLANLYGWNKQLPQFQDNRTYNILVQDSETKEVFNKLLEGKMPQGEERNDKDSGDDIT